MTEAPPTPPADAALADAVRFREPGWYWVRFPHRDDWDIAFWSHGEAWWFAGYQRAVTPVEIDERRITRPPAPASEGAALGLVAAAARWYFDQTPHQTAWEDLDTFERQSWFTAVEPGVKAMLTLNRQPAGSVVTAAERDVLAERRRQVEAEGWTPEHDDAHSRGQMATAAACYAFAAGEVDRQHIAAAIRGTDRFPVIARSWPWHWHWWKPTDRRRDLVKASALILAEIERLDRAAGLLSEEGT